MWPLRLNLIEHLTGLLLLDNVVAEGVEGRAVFGCSASQRLLHRQAEQSRNTPTQSNDPPLIIYPFSWSHIRFALEMTHAV